MLDREFIELSQMQLQRAEELLSEAAALISFGAYNSSVNRSYYAAFHAMKAVYIGKKYYVIILRII